MLTNLVENSMRASKTNSRIDVKAYFDKANIIEVTDYGMGIKKEDISKITEPFYRVDKSRSRKYGGVGLGLSIVSKIALVHSAKIEIHSQENKGTNIKIIFTKS